MSESAENKSSDSNIDTVCILLIITLVVGAALFWVTGQ